MNFLEPRATPHSAPSGAARPRLRHAAIFAFVLAGASIAFAQQVNPELYSGLRWRLIGPFRGGRVTAVAGIAGNPAVYYMGTPGGGVWKTTDGGQVWKPIFDAVPVASIGAVALAPSNPNIVYVGTGEQVDGNGVYKSSDAGATWTSVGLADTKFISSVLVDPRNPDIVLVGALGERVTAGAARGVFRSTDGGKTWTKALYKDDRTGVADMCFDPGDRRIVFVALWYREEGFGPPAKKTEQDGWIYKSTDGGATWKPVSENGLPTESRGRIGVAVAPGSRGQRVFAIMSQGLFRSDDAGASWRQITKDARVTGNSYFSRVYVDPQNANTVFVMQTSVYRSADGGETFVAYKGAPGGDDYHVMWIDPENSQRMILGVDQGATVSLDGGHSWSPWFNQPSGQLYNVVTDNQFPYHVYSQQQDSGTVAVPNRGDYGEITFRDWFSVGGFEFGYVAPDPLHPNIVFANSAYRTVERFDKTTGGIHYVFVPGSKFRSSGDAPLLFSPLHPETLYYATQYVLKTTDSGESWQIISPDLTAAPAHPGEKKNEGEKEDTPRRAPGVITAIAASPADAGVLWAGTSDGLIQMTGDAGGGWRNVTPAGLPARSSVRIIEASHYDPAAAFADITAPNDSHPYFFRTRDAGKTWQKIMAGLPDWGVAETIREDPVRRGLLYAGTQTSVYVSFDDGDHWQPLQLNLPTTVVRDLAVHGDDLVAATYGRALWILDDLTPLRQAGAEVAASDAYLYKPAAAMRVRWDNNQDTPLPPELPAAENPPDGAMVDYYLKDSPAGDIALEIRDAQGNLVRRFTSAAPPPETLPANVPEYWLAPPAVLPKKAGMNRFVWDLRYPDPAALPYGYYGEKLDYVEMTLTDNAILGHTPRHQPQGPFAVPGRYDLTLEAGGKKYHQPLELALDPRIPATRADLEEQLALAKQLTSSLDASSVAYYEVQKVSAAIAEIQKPLANDANRKDAADALASLGTEAGKLGEGSSASPGFGVLNREAARLLTMLDVSDLRPSESTRAAASELCASEKSAFDRWRKLNAESLPAVNQLLEKYKLAPLAAATPAAVTECGESGGK